jgi:putative hemolysin
VPDGSSSQLIAIIGICLILSAFFSAAETSLTSINKIRLRAMAEAGVKGAGKVEKITYDVRKLLSAILIGNNIVNIAIGSLTTGLAISLLGNDAGAIGLATAAATVLILIFGEITPKTYAAKNTERVSIFVAPVIQVCIFIFTPAVAILNFLTGIIVKPSGGDKADAYPLITENELKTMVDVGHEEGVIEDSEKKMINNVFDFGDNTAADVMTPRTEIISLPSDADFRQVMTAFKKEHCSRIPVYKEDMDHIVGILHFKDFIFCDMTDENFDIQKLMREPFFSYESKPTSKLFAEMRTDGIAMAIILDEYGGTLGLVSIQDLIEEIVGDISDEYDEDEIVSVKEDEYIVDGGTKIEDFNEMAGTNLQSEDYESLGGFVIELLGAIPEPGTAIEYEAKDEPLRIYFVIEEMNKNRIVKIRTTIVREKEIEAETLDRMVEA